MAIARFPQVVLDCPDPRALAQFYAALLDWTIERDEDDWCSIRAPHGDSLAFQQVEDFRAPQWPGQDHPQ